MGHCPDDPTPAQTVPPTPFAIDKNTATRRRNRRAGTGSAGARVAIAVNFDEAYMDGTHTHCTSTHSRHAKLHSESAHQSPSWTAGIITYN